MDDSIVRFISADHWENMVRRHAPGGPDGGVWVDDISANLEECLEEAWRKIPEGGFIGGPSWGCGPMKDGRFAVDTRRVIERFFDQKEDASERFIGGGEHPCWMSFKRKQVQERVLILSGSDDRQLNFFGEVSRENHQHYANIHGYSYRYELWDRREWDWSRGTLVWAKHRAMADALAEGCWDQVWWIDADAVFLNMEKRIDGCLHPHWDAVFPEWYHHGRLLLSTGVFGCRPAIEPHFRKLWDNGAEEEEKCEERAITSLVERRPDLWQGIQMVEHCVFNGFYGWNVHFTDPARNFICHLVGRSNLERRRLFTQVNEHFGVSKSSH